MSLSLCSIAVIAAEHENKETQDSEEIHGKHAMAVFLGALREDSENLGTLGIEYSYRINKLWSLGGVIERTEREKDSTVVLA